MKNQFCLGKIWRSLRAAPGSTSNELAARLQWSKGRTRNALQNLRRRGAARREGNGRHDRWFVVGNEAPAANWGLHPNSLRNLEHTVEERMARLKKAGEVLGWDVSPKPKPQRTAPHALDECWSRFISGNRRAA